MLDQHGSRLSAGAELALVMADVCAESDEYRQAVGHLEAVRAGRSQLPDEYERKRARWARHVRGDRRLDIAPGTSAHPG